MQRIIGSSPDVSQCYQNSLARRQSTSQLSNRRNDSSGIGNILAHNSCGNVLKSAEDTGKAESKRALRKSCGLASNRKQQSALFADLYYSEGDDNKTMMKNSLSQSTTDLRPGIGKYRNYESQQNYDNLPFYMRKEKGVKVAKFNLGEITAA